jgi:hypothetical protein
MALIIEDKKILFLQVPGTASTALEELVAGLPGGRSIGEKHATLDELRASGALDGLDLAGYDVAGVVRNHFDMYHAEWVRCRKRWILLIDKPESVGSWPEWKREQIKRSCVLDFSDYLRWAFSRHAKEDQQLELYGHYTKDCTRVFRKEAIGELTDWLSVRYGRPIGLPTTNVTKKNRPYWQEYDADARALISRLFRDELARHGYAF